MSSSLYDNPAEGADPWVGEADAKEYDGDADDEGGFPPWGRPVGRTAPRAADPTTLLAPLTAAEDALSRLDALAGAAAPEWRPHDRA